MKDSRIEILAKNLVNYSCSIKKGDNVLVDSVGINEDMICELVEKIYEKGAKPYVNIKNTKVERSVLLNCSREQLDLMAEYESLQMKNMDAYIGIRFPENNFEQSDVPSENMTSYKKYLWEPVHGKIRIPKTKWVVMRYPTSCMAHNAKMSTKAFEDFYFNVCNLDYSKMSKAMDPLANLINNSDNVHIVGQNTDISFSIKGMHAVKCDGKMNIPDGEVYTAPVKDSVNGYITYNTPSIYEGFTFENIRLEFKNGKIIKATANNTEKINNILDTDEGARYIGEFSFGINPYINNAIGDTLFDEKIAGSIHFTPGCSYDDCDNGNKSAVHWDLVYIQTPDYGGGEIYLDQKLIRKDGRFVTNELLCLNPENLI